MTSGKGSEERAANDTPTVLLVEDFDEIRLVIRMFLEMNGYKVIEANNGQQAVEAAEREHPNLIVMDIRLPVMDGFAATRAIREVPELAHVPIVVVSAHGTPEYRVKAAIAGCNAYLTKPLDFERLKSLLVRLLEQRDDNDDVHADLAFFQNGSPRHARTRHSTGRT